MWRLQAQQKQLALHAGRPLIKIAADVTIYDANTFAFAQLLSGFVLKFHDLRNDAFQRGVYLNKHI
jgi:hypothetical protein